jgi:hypothetical protein
VARFAFRGIAMADAAVSIPTWIGAYHKGMAEGMAEQEAIYYADKTVRDTQGGGGAKDLSQFQGGGSEAWKLMSMFYSYLNVYHNATQGLIEEGRTPGKSFAQWADLFWQVTLWTMISPIAAALLAGQGPDEDEDPLWWGLRRIGFGAFAGIPVIRDFAGTIEREMGGKPSGGFKLSPVDSGSRKGLLGRERLEELHQERLQRDRRLHRPADRPAGGHGAVPLRRADRGLGEPGEHPGMAARADLRAG